MKINKDLLNKSADSHAVMKNLNIAREFVSIDEITHLGLNEPDELDRCIFKLRNNEVESSSVEDRMNMSITQDFGESMFFKMRIRKLTYVGKPTIALFIVNTTKKVKEKLHRMREKEEEQSS